MGAFQSQLAGLPKIRAEITKATTAVGKRTPLLFQVVKMMVLPTFVVPIVALSKQMFELESLIDELEILVEKKEVRAWEKQLLAEFNEHVGQKRCAPLSFPQTTSR